MDVIFSYRDTAGDKRFREIIVEYFKKAKVL